MRIAVDFDDTLVMYSHNYTKVIVNNLLVKLCNDLIERGYEIFIVTARFDPMIGKKKANPLQASKEIMIPDVEEFCDQHFKDNKISGIYYTNSCFKGEILQQLKINALIDDSKEQRDDAISKGILAYDVFEIHRFVNLIEMIECDKFWSK